MPETTKRLIDNWEDDSLVITRDDLPSHLMEAMANELDTVVEEIDRLYANRFIETANEYELELIAQAVDVGRYWNEDVEDFRNRVLMAYRSASSDTSYDDFEAVVDTAFDDENYSIEIKEDGPTIVITNSLDSFTNPTNTLEFIVDRLDNALQSNHGVVVSGEGTFELGGFVEGDSIDEATTVSTQQSFAAPLQLNETLTLNESITIENKSYTPPPENCLNEGGLGIILGS